MTTSKKRSGFSMVALVALGLRAIPPAQAGRKVMPMPPIPKGTDQRKGVRARLIDALETTGPGTATDLMLHVGGTLKSVQTGLLNMRRDGLVESYYPDDGKPAGRRLMWRLKDV